MMKELRLTVGFCREGETLDAILARLLAGAAADWLREAGAVPQAPAP